MGDEAIVTGDTTIVHKYNSDSSRPKPEYMRKALNQYSAIDAWEMMSNHATHGWETPDSVVGFLGQIDHAEHPIAAELSEIFQKFQTNEGVAIIPTSRAEILDKDLAIQAMLQPFESQLTLERNFEVMTFMRGILRAAYEVEREY